MAFITNMNIDNNRVFDSEKSDISNDMLVDNSTMDQGLSDNMAGLVTAAKNKISSMKPIYDFKTKNTSFIKLYQDLVKMGIKNNKFFLKLYQKELQGVDVYHQIIPLDLQMKILLEIVINPWYFLREICRIPEDGSPIEVGGGTEFLIDRNSLASWYCYLNGIDHYDSKSRQLGKTHNAIAELNYAFHFGSLSATMLFFNKDFTLAKQNLYRLKCHRDMMPTFLQMKLAYTDDGGVDKGTDNITALRNPITNNTIKVMPTATSVDSARRLGRGETAALHYHDEHDFTPYNIEIQKAASFAYSKAASNAAKNGSLFCRIMTSTPGYLSTAEGKAAAKQIERMLRWDDHFYDEPINKLKAVLKSNKYNNIMYIEHSWKQLKKSVSWYEDQCRLVDYDADTILREIDLQRIQGNNRSPFKKHQLVYITQHVREPITQLDLSNNLCPIFIYEKLNPATHYILAVDPAEGLALNNNAFELINPYTLCSAAEFKSPYISPPDYFRLMCKFMDQYCPRSMIVIEANRGRELINRFMESKYKYQLWYDAEKLTSKIVENVGKYGEQKQAANQRRAYGFDTTRSSRPLLFAVLENFMMEQIHKIYTPYVVKDIASVQRKPNGEIILGAGDDKDDDEEGVGHGDNLMAYLIGLFVYYNASNLDEFGIPKGIPEPKDMTTAEEIEDKKDQMRTAIASLPPEMQDLFRGVIGEKDEISSAWEYQKQVQAEIDRQAVERGEKSFIVQDPEDNQVDDSNWDALSRQVFEANFKKRPIPNNQDYGYNPGYGANNYDTPDNGFNVDDWV